MGTTNRVHFWPEIIPVATVANHAYKKAEAERTGGLSASYFGWPDTVGEQHMAWKVQLDPKHGFIEIVFTGTITKKDSLDSTVAALKLATRERAHLFLSDVSAAASDLSALDICSIPSQWDALKANPEDKLALIVPQRGYLKSDGQFYEMACVNEGWKVKTFTSRIKAIEWLTGG